MNTKILRGLALGALVVVAGCTSGADEAATETDEAELGVRVGNVDNVAIVEATTMMLAGGPVDRILDPHNQDDPFALRRTSYANTLEQRLAMFDRSDGKPDWKESEAQAWVLRMSTANYQVVDTSKPCDFGVPRTYLEIERARLTGRPHATCGGRMPNEDALDVTLNFLVRGPRASAYDVDAMHDGVDQATKRSTDAFPYLAEMNGL